MDSLAQELEQGAEADKLSLALRAPVGEAPELLELDRVLVTLDKLPDLLLESDTLGFEQKRSCASVRERILHLREPCLVVRGRVEECANLVQQEGEIVRHRGLSSIEALPPGDHGPVGLSSPVRRPRGRRSWIAVFVSALALATAGTASAALSGELTRALTVRGVSWQATGALVLDLRNGGLVYAKHADRSLRPASNEKLVVALAALDRLGPAARIPTRVLGRGSASESVWQGALILKGYGDPTLTGSDLAVLAKRVRLSGINTVTGKVLADETYFDTRRVAPGWKPSYYKEECPPLSALVVDEAKVLGRTVDTPALAAARAFRKALTLAGVRVLRGAGVGAAGDGDTLVSQILSPSTAGLVRQMNRQSDNFVAEMLLKRLGARVLDRGETAAGISVARQVLRMRGVPLAGVRLADGSGLSSYDRLTARAIAAILVTGWSDPGFRRPFVSSLPLAGVNGTLKDRLRSYPARGFVRAKTGTTNRASSLSGFVGTRYVFSVLQNGAPIPWLSARQGQDRFVQILAGRAR
jgi:D-alanyl-D-alanine carboxypeptidase/D-alanyl-D-alanine-endopeptidase (penicillin-binding protein 4)